jgi:hypothetical protein
MVTDNITLRIELLKQRSEMDWGEAPKYNEAYRLIRWPGIKHASVDPIPARPIGEEVVRTVETNVLGERVVRLELQLEEERHGRLDANRRPYERLTPGWLRSIREQRAKKAAGTWNEFHRRGRTRDYLKSDTRECLMRDLRYCIKENIPFKTKSLEYNPKDQWIYVYGNRAVKYDIDSGKLVAFTYSGVYNKVTSLILRNLSINVKLEARKLVWHIESRVNGTRAFSRVDIDLHGVYNLVGLDTYRYYHQIDVRQPAFRLGPEVVTTF